MFLPQTLVKDINSIYIVLVKRTIKTKFSKENEDGTVNSSKKTLIFEQVTTNMTGPPYNI